MISNHIKIAECDGGIEVVSRELYDRIYREIATALKNEGATAVLALKKQARRAATSGARNAVLLTVIEELPDGTVRLRTADEVDYYRRSRAA
ncbi:hypothetical protein A2118_01175 [Candidatus Kaiserbacteria bacterium GWA2_50_9]|uniref:Uncharacterized protein n=1 Tax=Candidatus Kaiserbacteria bacterium GWA2_50_9 TaxID=1798474 RepID=A0A1F6BT62_9BACT|nr:MAG: hypothetical protein A2118_01175 [Candidatus Kaiserbacteria bacterium GWA2_50_9]